MATDRLLREREAGDVPKISLGNFNWQPVERASITASRAPAEFSQISSQAPAAAQLPIAAKRSPSPAKDLTEKEFPLNLLQNKTFAGTGYNVVWRPRTIKPGVPLDTVEGSLPDVLELNLTAETMAFTGSLGNVPNRGSGHQKDGTAGDKTPQSDLMLKGISYIQRVGAFENNATGSNDIPEPVGIHFEPGVFMLVPASTNPKQPATLNRMASIPHGTTINAQGLIQNKQTRAPDPIKDFRPLNIIPFKLNTPEVLRTAFPQLDFPVGVSTVPEQDRLPQFLSKFTGPGKLITKEIFKDPNEVLRVAIKGQDIDSFVTFELTTQPNSPFLGGQTANIGFLEGTPLQLAAGQGNAHAIKMTVQYWIETVAKTLTIQPKQVVEQSFEVVSAAGVLGPTYIVPVAASATLTTPVQKRVTWTQIQYSQNVTLNFNGLSWPHISVATLGDTSTVTLEAKDLVPSPKPGVPRL